MSGKHQHLASAHIDDDLDDIKGRNVKAHLLNGALLLNLALSQFLQQDQLSLLDSQFFFQLLNDVLPFLRRTLLHTQAKSYHPHGEPQYPRNDSKNSGNKQNRVFLLSFLPKVCPCPPWRGSGHS